MEESPKYCNGKKLPQNNNGLTINSAIRESEINQKYSRSCYAGKCKELRIPFSKDPFVLDPNHT